MQLQKNYPLKSLNTFGIDVKASFYTEFYSVEELQEILRDPEVKDQEKLILGGGSNILFTQDYDGVVLKNNITGITIEGETAEHVLVKAGAGVKWHDLVLFSLREELGGIENLSLIPGTVGAAPLQNIGAYGVELKNVFEELEAVEISTGIIRKFGKEECAFGYRESVFKNIYKGQFVVTHVTLRLHKKPDFNITYGAIKNTLEAMQVKDLTLQAVSDAVVSIRQSKLPDPAKIGNAGSFFKNPEIPKSDYDKLKEQYPKIPGYVVSEEAIKVPAGWLIEQCGWKGKVMGNYGVHKDQALVLVNYGGAEGRQVKELAFQIIDSVEKKFGIRLQPEVNIL